MTVIQVTKLNGNSFTINALLIEKIESFPDTTITLTNGKKFVVKENEHLVRQLAKDFYQVVGLLGRDFLEDMKNEEE